MGPMSSAAEAAPAPAAQADKRFRILVCIDGTEESHRALRYAARIGRGNDADLVVVNVRSPEEGLRINGLKERLAHEDMLHWGLEIPGIRHLRKARDLLLEVQAVEDRGWQEEVGHVDVEGDELGDNKIVYTNPAGKKVILKLKVSDDPVKGILDQWDIGRYDLIILGASRKEQSLAKSIWDPSVADRIAWRAPCSVLVASALEEGHGHLICTDGSDRAMETARRDAMIASRCNCAISLISVVTDDGALVKAKENVERTAHMLAGLGIPVLNKLTPVGVPAEEIIQAGQDFSVIVLADSGKRGFLRFVKGSVASTVLDEAHHSVMVVR
ncbi:MAG: universal stress protein [Pseudomonadota bacterium]